MRGAQRGSAQMGDILGGRADERAALGASNPQVCVGERLIEGLAVAERTRTRAGLTFGLLR